ncbi:hypothetical protein C3Y91_24550 [Rhizobium sp. UPM1133]|nr:hypothetical protein [Rhizobium ruizarguesonis]
MKMRLMGFPFAAVAAVNQLSVVCSMRELGCGFPRSVITVITAISFVRMPAPHPNPLPVKTGRGDVPCGRLARYGEVAAYPLRPASGEKVAAAG